MGLAAKPQLLYNLVASWLKMTNKNQGGQQAVSETEQQAAKKYKVQHDRPNCIGCAACAAVAPDFWTMNEDGKSDIAGGRNLDGGQVELDIDEKDLAANKEAADSCPVNAIHIINKKTKEKII